MLIPFYHYYNITDVPEPLNKPEVTSHSSNSITLRWDPSTASLLDYYILEFWKANFFSETYTVVPNIETNNYTMDGLDPETTYSARVAASNVFGRGRASPSVHKTTKAGPGSGIV